MTIGKIKWFNPTRGYGFIENEGSKDVFLHVSALEKAGIDTLQEGQEIEFDIGENKGKENAINVRKVEVTLNDEIIRKADGNNYLKK
jgi:CspA family cold shock protein